MKHTLVGGIVVAIILSVTLISCTGNLGGGAAVDDIQELGPVEVRQYEGERNIGKTSRDFDAAAEIWKFFRSL